MKLRELRIAAGRSLGEAAEFYAMALLQYSAVEREDSTRLEFQNRRDPRRLERRRWERRSGRTRRRTRREQLDGRRLGCERRMQIGGRRKTQWPTD